MYENYAHPWSLTLLKGFLRVRLLEIQYATEISALLTVSWDYLGFLIRPLRGPLFLKLYQLFNRTLHAYLNFRFSVYMKNELKFVTRCTIGYI